MTQALRTPLCSAASAGAEWLEPGFGEDCASIHAKGFLHPWSGTEFLSLLSAPECAALGVFRPPEHNAPGLQLKSRLKGFIIGKIAADEAEILTFAVDTPDQRQGTGTLLLHSFKSHMASIGVKKIFLEVDEANQAARSIYEKSGFKTAGIRKSYYRTKDNQRSDALIMTAELFSPFSSIETHGHET